MAIEHQDSYNRGSYGGDRGWDNSRSYGNTQGGWSSQGAGGKWGNDQGDKLQSIEWKSTELIAFKKDFYSESQIVRDMSSREVDDFRAKHEIAVSGRNPPRPIPTFKAAGFPSSILTELESAGFPSPTPVQCQGWPVALSGHDLISIAATGSGKTLAFLLPAIVHIQAQPRLQRGEGPIALVLAPTRELACQILVECKKFGSSSGIRSVCCYGGVPKGDQARDLRYGAEVVIATPGRLIDFLEFGTTNLKRVTYLVLDEADRMLDMGFEPQVRKIGSQIRPDRQSLFFSATWPKEIQGLARDLCREDPVMVTCGSAGRKANDKITQHVVICEEHEKEDRLRTILEAVTDATSKVIIFTETKRGADQLQRNLRQSGVRALAIHGDKSQQERDWTLDQFKKSHCMMLIATDVASRGLDIKDINYVINYDMPKEIDSFIHRVGRTARGAAHGTAYTLFTSANSYIAKDLVKTLHDCNQKIPAELEAMVQHKGGNGRGGYGGGNRGWGGNSRGSWGGGNKWGGGGGRW
jgi:ATP-dependent RNA helicase DDX5/DBP2